MQLIASANMPEVKWIRKCGKGGAEEEEEEEEDEDKDDKPFFTYS